MVKKGEWGLSCSPKKLSFLCLPFISVTFFSFKWTLHTPSYPAVQKKDSRRNSSILGKKYWISTKQHRGLLDFYSSRFYLPLLHTGGCWNPTRRWWDCRSVCGTETSKRAASILIYKCCEPGNKMMLKLWSWQTGYSTKSVWTQHLLCIVHVNPSNQ